MGKFKRYRTSNVGWLSQKPIPFSLTANEFDEYLKEYPELKKEAEKYAWNINNRFDSMEHHGEEDIIKCFKEAVEYVHRSATPRHWKIALHYELLKNYLLEEELTTVLDFGCGGGNDGMFYANIGFNVTFSDVDGVNLEFIRWRLKRRGINYCEVIPSNEKFDNKQYGLVLAIDCLEHCTNAHNYFNRIRDVLKPNGLLFISFNSEGKHLDCYSAEEFAEHIKPQLNSMFTILEVEGSGILYRKTS